MLFTLNAKFSLEHTNLNLGWNRIRVHGAMSMLSFSEKNTVIIAVNSTQHTKRKKSTESCIQVHFAIVNHRTEFELRRQ